MNNNGIQEMVNEFHRLFFLYHQNKIKENDEWVQKILKKQDNLLKQLKAKGYDVAKLVEECKIQKCMESDCQYIVVFSDGGVRHHDQLNLSHAASAFVVYQDNKLLTHKRFYIGTSLVTPDGQKKKVNSTFAEYHGLWQAVSFVKRYKLQAKQIIFLTDCLTIVRHTQQAASLPVDSGYRPFALGLSDDLQTIPAQIKHIPRGKNKVADQLVNQELYLYERSHFIWN